MHPLAGLAVFALIVACAAPAHSLVTGYVPRNYRSSANAIAGATIEDFEDGLLNVPGMSVSSGHLGDCPDSICNSVDGDDGIVDGSGANGRAWSVDGTSLTITFDASVLGALPGYAGLVVTDVAPGGDFASAFRLEVFGPGGALDLILEEWLFGADRAPGNSAEDRFFGGIQTEGISAIRLSNIDPGSPTAGDWQVDHIQFAFAPEPTPSLLIGIGLACLSGARGASARRQTTTAR